MREGRGIPLTWPRGIALGGIVAMGLVTIVGSGGGGDPCATYGAAPVSCYFPAGPPVTIQSAAIFPARVTLQVGCTAAFSVQTVGISNPTFLWQMASNGGSFVDIAGATDATYTLAAARLIDDDTRLRVLVSGAVPSSEARIAVSSMPGVVFEDGEFPLSGWAVTAVANPVQNVPTHTEEQVTSGGNPGAFRRLVHAMPAGPNTLLTFHSFQPAAYDPAIQGSIYVIDVAMDCIRLQSYLRAAATTLLIEQDARRFVAFDAPCGYSTWTQTLSAASLGVADFKQVDGASCSPGERCPDFSANGKPLRVGFASRYFLFEGDAAGTTALGVDNWKVTIWRR